MTKLEMLTAMCGDEAVHASKDLLSYLSKADIERCYKAFKNSNRIGKLLLLDTALANRVNGKKPCPLYYYFNGKKHCL